jgi:CRP-like cAMP-binding protein
MGNFECGNICKKNNNFIDLSKETNLKKKISIKNEENENSIMSMNNENSSEKNSENNNLTNINYKFLKYNADSTMRESFLLSKKHHRIKFINEINALTILDEEDDRSLKTKIDLKMINEAFSHHFFIKSLSEKNKEKIIEEMKLATIGPNKIIFKQGFEGLFFYILKNGIVELQINKKIIKKLGKGDSFGEFALLHNAPRSGTIRTLTQCELWILERNSFRKIVEESTKENFKENQKFINSISILRVLEGYQQSLLCSSLYKEIYLEKQIIAREGDDANCIIFIKEGEVNCVKNNKIIRTLHKHDYFGERSIFVEGKRSLDVIANTNCICYAISFTSLEKILGIYYRDELCKQIIKASFLESKCFKEISVVYLDKIYKLFLMKNFKKNEVVCATGSYYSDKVIVIIDGNLISNDNKKEIVGKRGELIFDSALLNNSNDEINHDLIADPDCLLVETDPQKIFDLLKVKNFKEILKNSFHLKMLKNSDFLKKLPIDKIEDLLEKMTIKKY